MCKQTTYNVREYDDGWIGAHGAAVRQTLTWESELEAAGMEHQLQNTARAPPQRPAWEECQRLGLDETREAASSAQADAPNQADGDDNQESPPEEGAAVQGTAAATSPDAGQLCREGSSSSATLNIRSVGTFSRL